MKQHKKKDNTSKFKYDNLLFFSRYVCNWSGAHLWKNLQSDIYMQNTTENEPSKVWATKVEIKYHVFENNYSWVPLLNTQPRLHQTASGTCRSSGRMPYVSRYASFPCDRLSPSWYRPGYPGSWTGCRASNTTTAAWVAEKDLSWLQLSDFFEFSNFHRTLNFRTYNVPNSQNAAIFRKMLHFGKIPKTIGQNLAKIQQNFNKICNILKKISKKCQQFLTKKIEIRERCKGVHCVDLGESFPTNIYLQKSASIQPRTSPSKFGGKIQFNIHFTP